MGWEDTARFYRQLGMMARTGMPIGNSLRLAGDTAGRIAGRIRQQGQFVMLLPRELDMVEAGRHTPLPEPKPPIPQQVATKEAAPEPGEPGHGTAAEPKASIHRSHQPPQPMSRRQARIRSRSGT